MNCVVDIYDIEPIAVRLEILARLQFFHKICCVNNLNYLLPIKRPHKLLDRLHQPNSSPGYVSQMYSAECVELQSKCCVS